MIGTGHRFNPYIIRTESDLIAINQDVYGHYILNNNIVLVNEWAPITNFYGTIDGRGYSISNLTIMAVDGSGAERPYIGFIGFLRPKSTIKNLTIHTSTYGIEGVSTTYNGVLAAQAYASEYGFTIDNVSVSGNIISGGDRCGGLIGFCDSKNSSIKDCIVNVYMTGGGGFTGGVIGKPWGDSVHAANIFYNSTNGATSAGITAQSITNFKDTTQYNGVFDFINVWEITAESSVPTLIKPNTYTGTGTDVISGFVEGVTQPTNVTLIDKYGDALETQLTVDFLFSNYDISELDGIILIDNKITFISYYTVTQQVKGYITGSVSDTCTGTNFKIRCYREDGFFIGDYDIVNGTYEIPNLNIHSTYDVLLYDLNLSVETQVNSRRIPTQYNTTG